MSRNTFPSIPIRRSSSIMATLQLLWDDWSYDLWSWTMGEIHHTARIMRHIRNNVYLAHFGPRETQPSQVVVAKMARGEDEMHSLTRETEFYTKDLHHLQGIIIPRLLGFFRGKVHGVEVGCLLLEHCYGYPAMTEEEQEEQDQATLTAVGQLHRAGVLHGGLSSRHHLLRMGSSVRIIDFSLAVRHRCPSTFESNRRYDTWNVAQCQELIAVERGLRRIKGEYRPEGRSNTQTLQQ